jgi:eukaryotic-like serine/threonine-protein kinase
LAAVMARTLAAIARRAPGTDGAERHTEMTAQWFGDYEIVKRLRVGGMATLYLARRHGVAGFARLVALKLIHPHLVEQPTFIEMFVDEARICSQISHPNVVHVEEFGVIDDVHYLVMEYLDGCSLGELLVMHHRERRTIDPELSARIIMQVASGLHAAHEARDPEGQPLEVVHRDISPSNVLLSRDGNAKLIDFGIAKARNRLAETAAGIALKGKFNYVAPEQATGTAADRRCDLFSLGVVFWELLVGKPLFPEDTHVALFNRLARTDVTPPSALNPAVPAALDSIVLKMLQHDPANRPQTAAELERAIAHAIPGAANRDPSELGALAIEARDKRVARRLREPTSHDSHASFVTSPSPRPSRTAEYRGDRELTFTDDVATPTPTPTPTPAPIASPPRTRRRVQLLGAGLLGLGVTLGIVVSRPAAPRSGGPTTVVPSPLVVASPPGVVASPPPPIVASPPPPIVASPPPPVVVSSPAPAALAPATIAAAPAAPARSPARPAPPMRRDAGHVVARPRPGRHGPGDGEARPGSDTPSPAASRGRPGFSTAPFDAAGNERGAPIEPGAASGKKPPITPDFDN